MPRPFLRFTVALLFCLVCRIHAQLPVTPTRVYATSEQQRAIRAFDAAKKNQLELSAFLRDMPKGGDLHMHLS